MASVRQVDREGTLFIAGETGEVYQHTAGLVILDTSNCPDFSFEYLKEKLIERIRDVPHFRWRLEEVPLGLDMPYWVEDEDFCFDNHFKRIAIQQPYRYRSLFGYFLSILCCCNHYKLSFIIILNGIDWNSDRV